MRPHLFLHYKSGPTHDEIPAETKKFCQWKNGKEKNHVQGKVCQGSYKRREKNMLCFILINMLRINFFTFLGEKLFINSSVHNVFLYMVLRFISALTAFSQTKCWIFAKRKLFVLHSSESAIEIMCLLITKEIPRKHLETKMTDFKTKHE